MRERLLHQRTCLKFAGLDMTSACVSTLLLVDMYVYRTTHIRPGLSRALKIDENQNTESYSLHVLAIYLVGKVRASKDDVHIGPLIQPGLQPCPFPGK